MSRTRRHRWSQPTSCSSPTQSGKAPPPTSSPRPRLQLAIRPGGRGRGGVAPSMAVSWWKGRAVGVRRRRKVRTEGSSSGGIRWSANCQPPRFKDCFSANGPALARPAPPLGGLVRVRVMYIYKIYISVQCALLIGANPPLRSSVSFAVAVHMPVGGHCRRAHRGARCRLPGLTKGRGFVFGVQRPSGGTSIVVVSDFAAGLLQSPPHPPAVPNTQSQY